MAGCQRRATLVAPSDAPAIRQPVLIALRAGRSAKGSRRRLAVESAGLRNGRARRSGHSDADLGCGQREQQGESDKT